VNQSQLVTVLKPNSPAVSAIAESVLRDANIPYVIGGDQAFQNLYSIGPTEIQVHEQDADAAKELLNSL
jgi:hypothetical protein